MSGTNIYNTNAGKVGIGTASPQTKLDVAGAVRIGNAGEQCQAMSEGAQRYDSATKQMEYCDGTDWNSFAGGYIRRTNSPWTTPAAVSCQGADKVIGGGCSCGGGNASVHTSYPSSDTQWMCECIDVSGAPSPVATAWAICANMR